MEGYGLSEAWGSVEKEEVDRYLPSLPVPKVQKNQIWCEKGNLPNITQQRLNY
jgi:hypothetical protein